MTYRDDGKVFFGIMYEQRNVYIVLIDICAMKSPRRSHGGSIYEWAKRKDETTG